MNKNREKSNVILDLFVFEILIFKILYASQYHFIEKQDRD